MITIRLVRRVPVVGWRVSAEVAFAESRDWEPAVMKEAVALGAITPELIENRLLGGRPEAARRIVQLCERLGLLTQLGRTLVPTDRGREVAASGLVLVPRRGAWNLWAARDVLLPSSILGVTPSSDEPPATAERGKRQRRNLQAIPDWVTEPVGRDVQPIMGKKTIVCVHELGERADPLPEEPDLRVELTVTPERVQLKVRGEVEGLAIDQELPPPPLVYDDVLRLMLTRAGLRARWSPEHGALLARFGETDDTMRATMLRSALVERPELDGVGAFDPSTLNGIPLRPATTDDAREWARWRSMQQLSGFVIGDVLARDHARAAAPFADIAPAAPLRAELIARLGTGARSKAYWWLHAPADWALEEPS